MGIHITKELSSSPSSSYFPPISSQSSPLPALFHHQMLRHQLPQVVLHGLMDSRDTRTRTWDTLIHNLTVSPRQGVDLPFHYPDKAVAKHPESPTSLTGLLHRWLFAIHDLSLSTVLRSSTPWLLPTTVLLPPQTPILLLLPAVALHSPRLHVLLLAVTALRQVPGNELSTSSTFQ